MQQKITLIADSGSTKTEWRLIVPADSKVYEFRTQGLNPYYLTAESIYMTIERELDLPISEKKIEHINFYGAGCGTEAKRKDMKTALIAAFPNADIEVKTDIEGAATGICAGKDGIVCISGTGSNACLVKNGVIVVRVPSLGIWLGDEGSAGHIGKLLVSDYLLGIMPAAEVQVFEMLFSDRKDNIMENVYQKKLPNQYLASFAPFASQYVSTYTQGLVRTSYELFIERYFRLLPEWQNYPIYFVGSTAVAFASIINELLGKLAGKVAEIIETPIQYIVKSYYPSN